MPVLLQICIVMLTIALLAIAVVTVRMITRVSKLAEDISLLTLGARESLAQVNLVASEAQAVVALVRDCVPPIRRVVDGFAAIGQRTADLSSAVLEEIALPVFTAAAVARGVSSGANHLLNRLKSRVTHRNSRIHGGFDHE